MCPSLAFNYELLNHTDGKFYFQLSSLWGVEKLYIFIARETKSIKP